MKRREGKRGEEKRGEEKGKEQGNRARKTVLKNTKKNCLPFFLAWKTLFCECWTYRLSHNDGFSRSPRQ